MLGNTQRLPPRDGAHAWPTVVIYKTRLVSRGVCCFGVGERSPRDGFYFKLCRVLHCLDCLHALGHTCVFERAFSAADVASFLSVCHVKPSSAVTVVLVPPFWLQICPALRISHGSVVTSIGDFSNCGLDQLKPGIGENLIWFPI